MKGESYGAQKQATCAIWGLTSEPKIQQKIVALPGAVERLVELLRKDEGETQGFAAAALVNLANDEGGRQQITSVGGAGPLMTIALGPDNWLRGQCVQVLKLLGYQDPSKKTGPASSGEKETISPRLAKFHAQLAANPDMWMFQEKEEKPQMIVNEEHMADLACKFKKGDRVLVEPGERKAEVMYIGKIPEIAPGYWIGVMYDEPVGKNDGSIKGHRLFECQHDFGGVLRPDHLAIDPNPPPPRVKKEVVDPAAEAANPDGEDSKADAKAGAKGGKREGRPSDAAKKAAAAKAAATGAKAKPNEEEAAADADPESEEAEQLRSLDERNPEERRQQEPRGSSGAQTARPAAQGEKPSKGARSARGPPKAKGAEIKAAEAKPAESDALTGAEPEPEAAEPASASASTAAAAGPPGKRGPKPSGKKAPPSASAGTRKEKEMPTSDAEAAAAAPAVAAPEPDTEAAATAPDTARAAPATARGTPASARGPPKGPPGARKLPGAAKTGAGAAKKSSPRQASPRQHSPRQASPRPEKARQASPRGDSGAQTARLAAQGEKPIKGARSARGPPKKLSLETKA